MISFEIPDIPKTPNQLLRKHWAVITKEKNQWLKLVRLYCRYYGKPMDKAKITMTRHSSIRAGM